MALINAYQIPNTSLIMPEAYWRIESFYGSKHQVTVVVNIYASELDADVSANPIGTKVYAYSPALCENGDLKVTNVDQETGKVLEYISDFIAQGYIYMLSLPDFKDAVSV